MREAYIPAGNRWDPCKYPGEHTGMVFLHGIGSPGYFLGFHQKTGSPSLGVIQKWLWRTPERKGLLLLSF